MTWRRVAGSDAFALEGAFDERTDLSSLLAELPTEFALDLSGVTHINSTGVRAWSEFLFRVGQQGKQATLKNCSVTFTSQMNMIGLFADKCRVESFLAGFTCTDCGREEGVHVTVGPGARDTLERSRQCSACGGPMDFDDLVDAFKAFFEPERS